MTLPQSRGSLLTTCLRAQELPRRGEKGVRHALSSQSNGTFPRTCVVSHTAIIYDVTFLPGKLTMTFVSDIAVVTTKTTLYANVISWQTKNSEKCTYRCHVEINQFKDGMVHIIRGHFIRLTQAIRDCNVLITTDLRN